MSVKSAPYFWLRCDNCGHDITGDTSIHDYVEFSTLAERGQAVEFALNVDWTTDGVRHHCPGCPELGVCVQCGSQVESAAERDYHCERCWAERGEGATR